MNSSYEGVNAPPAEMNFDQLERVDNWWVSVVRSTRHEAARVGADAWNHDPAVSQRRERSVRLMRRAFVRVTGELARLDASGVPAHVSRDHLHANRRARDRARSTRARS
jgi:hypothetical protein